MSSKTARKDTTTQGDLFNPQHSFGGDWTELKLKILQGYLKAYLTALKKQPFDLIYIDAFAGTGYRSASSAQASDELEDDPGQQLLFDKDGAVWQGSAQHSGDLTSPPGAPDPDVEAMRADATCFLEGSVVKALKLEPGFRSYHFMEQNSARAEQLRQTAAQFADRRIEVHEGDANEALVRLLRRIPWGRREGAGNRFPKAVLFLDPYGMNVNWSTLEAVAKTRSIDVWYLVPVGMGLLRMLPKETLPSDAWCRRLDKTLGTHAWSQRFYQVKPQQSLFTQSQGVTRIADLASMESFMLERLKTLFPHVCSTPKRFCNSRGFPMYSFCYAAAHEQGGEIGVRIADYLLKKEDF